MDGQGAFFLTIHSRVPVYTGNGDLVEWNKRKPPRQNHHMALSHPHDIHSSPLNCTTSLTSSLFHGAPQPPPSILSVFLLAFTLQSTTTLTSLFYFSPPTSDTSGPWPLLRPLLLPAYRPATLRHSLICIASNYLYILANNLEVFKRISTTRPTHDRDSLEGARHDKTKVRMMGGVWREGDAWGG
ncbi:hypothetical protein B0T13DRAFT_514879 [Neurospora crassa]|nr:hypothetical protein B0T13DRAFT_514879 [Neurospora crassa]